MQIYDLHSQCCLMRVPQSRGVYCHQEDINDPPVTWSLMVYYLCKTWGESSLNWVVEICPNSFIALNRQPRALPSHQRDASTCQPASPATPALIDPRFLFTRSPGFRWCPARTTIGSSLRPSPRWLVEWQALGTWPLQWASSHGLARAAHQVFLRSKRRVESLSRFVALTSILGGLEFELSQRET